MNTPLPVTYGYARVSKSDDDSRNLATQLRILTDHGIRDHLIYTDIASGSSLKRPGWQSLMQVLQANDTLIVAFLDRLSRNFDEGISIQCKLTEQNIATVAIRENIDTREDSAAAKFFRRSMLAQGAYQLDLASERIKLGQQRARDQGRMVGRPPALTPEQIEQCQRMREEGASLRQMGRVMNCSPSTIKRTLDDMVTDDMVTLKAE